MAFRAFFNYWFRAIILHTFWGLGKGLAFHYLHTVFQIGDSGLHGGWGLGFRLPWGTDLGIMVFTEA